MRTKYVVPNSYFEEGGHLTHLVRSMIQFLENGLSIESDKKVRNRKGELVSEFQVYSNSAFNYYSDGNQYSQMHAPCGVLSHRLMRIGRHVYNVNDFISEDYEEIVTSNGTFYEYKEYYGPIWYDIYFYLTLYSKDNLSHVERENKYINLIQHKSKIQADNFVYDMYESSPLVSGRVLGDISNVNASTSEIKVCRVIFLNEESYNYVSLIEKVQHEVYRLIIS